MKVTITAVFIFQLTLGPVHTVNTNENSFHFSIKMLMMATKECWKQDVDLSQIFQKAVEHLTEIFKEQNNKILDLEEKLTLMIANRTINIHKKENDGKEHQRKRRAVKYRNKIMKYNEEKLTTEHFPGPITIYAHYVVLNDKGRSQLSSRAATNENHNPNQKSEESENYEMRSAINNDNQEYKTAQELGWRHEIEEAYYRDQSPDPIVEDNYEVRSAVNIGNQENKNSQVMSQDCDSLNTMHGNLLPIVRELTEKEKDLVKAAKGISPSSVIGDLCAEGVNPNIGDINNENSTALHMAVTFGGKLETLMLIRCGANVNMVNGFGDTPLHISIKKQRYWINVILMLNHAKPFIKNCYNQSSYDLGIDALYYSTRKLFASQAINWFKPVKKQLRPPEAILQHMSKMSDYLGIMELCIKGYSVNEYDAAYNTALHHAVLSEWSNEETILTLLHCGANINAQNIDGDTALHLSVKNVHPNVTIALLIKGSDPFITNKLNKTALELGKESPDPIIADIFTTKRYSWFMNHL